MKSRKRNEGIALIWAALILLLMVSFLGLAVDFGLMVWTGQQLQIAADGAALAGAQFVRTDESKARDQAQLVGQSNKAGGVAIKLNRNDANAAAGDIVIGRFDRKAYTFDPAGSPNSVKVVARRTAGSLNGSLQTVFARVMGMNALDMQRTGTAIVGGGTGTGILILDNGARCALTIRGNPTVDLADGAIQVNSTNSCGTCLQGSPDILASEINMVGSFCLTGVKESEVPPLNSYQPPIADPLAALPAPAYNVANNLGTIKASKTYNPGYYAGGIDMSGGNVILNPGVYVLGGAGIDIRGNANFTANGVMLYLAQGGCNINGSGNLTLTPPDPSLYSGADQATYEGVAMFQARNNTTAGTVNGTANNLFKGTYYFPNNKINLGGTANQFGDQFIAWEAEIFGNGYIKLAVDGTIPAPGNRVFLVK